MVHAVQQEPELCGKQVMTKPELKISLKRMVIRQIVSGAFSVRAYDEDGNEKADFEYVYSPEVKFITALAESAGYEIIHIH